MAINLSAIEPATTTAVALSNLILVNPQDDAGIQPQTLSSETIRPKKFLFNYYGENSLDLECDITDHFIEDNSALQDQISIKPDLISGQGYIGELTDITPQILKPLKIAASKLTVISAYVPQISISAQIAYNSAFQAYQIAQLAAQSAVQAWSSLAGTDGTTIGNAEFSAVQTKQAMALQMFYGYQKERRLFTVQTPWAVFQNCAIRRIHVVQDAETNSVSSFDVTFKPIRFARTTSVGLQSNGEGRFIQQSQASDPTNLGDSVGAPTPYTQSDLYTNLVGG